MIKKKTIFEHIGLKYGQLEIISYSHLQGHRHYFFVKCDCGSEPKAIAIDNVVRTKYPTLTCGGPKHYNSGLRSLQYQVFTASKYNEADITLDDFIDMQTVCFWCGGTPDEVGLIASSRSDRTKNRFTWKWIGLDRIDPFNPLHEKSNVIPSCWNCNENRKKRTMEEYKAKIDRRYLWLHRNDKK